MPFIEAVPFNFHTSPKELSPVLPIYTDEEAEVQKLSCPESYRWEKTAQGFESRFILFIIIERLSFNCHETTKSLLLRNMEINRQDRHV